MKLHKDLPTLVNTNPVADKIGPQVSGTRDKAYVVRTEAQAGATITKDSVLRDRDLPMRDALLKETSGS